jgi:hypothetical protein
MDGTLRRVTPHTWVGTLNGHEVHATEIGGRWHFAVIHPGGDTQVCARADSLADGGRRARAWVESHGPPWRPPGS